MPVCRALACIRPKSVSLPASETLGIAAGKNYPPCGRSRAKYAAVAGEVYADAGGTVIRLLMSITPKRAVLALLAAGWLGLLASGHGVLMGSSTRYYPAKFTVHKKAFESVTCRYWTGFGWFNVHKTGVLGSVRCAGTARLERKSGRGR